MQMLQAALGVGNALNQVDAAASDFCLHYVTIAGQGAIAAKPSATYRGYLLGGLCWFAVPFTMATSMGLGARAMVRPHLLLTQLGDMNQSADNMQ